MSFVYNVAPPYWWQEWKKAVDILGQVFILPAAGYRIYTKSSQNHTIDKATYKDPNGLVLNQNPIICDDQGRAVIYWAINLQDPTDNYYVEVRDENDVLVYSFDNFNASPLENNSPSPSSNNPVINYFRNPYFTYWKMYDYADIDVTCNPSDCTFAVEFANEWIFLKSNANATDLLSRGIFLAGQTSVPDSPTYYLNAQCTSAGSGGETFKKISQRFNDVNTFSSQTINVSFYAISFSGTPSIQPVFTQFYGSGGSSTVNTAGQTINLTNTWARYSMTINVPSNLGKTIGSGNYSELAINFPINSTYNIGIACAQLTVGTTLYSFLQLTLPQQLLTLPTYSQEDTGTIKIYPQAQNSNYPNTWIPLNSGTIGTYLSNATVASFPLTKSLFLFLWNTYPDQICPVYNSSGQKVARGVNALADFNAKNQIALFESSGRALINQGVPGGNFSFTVSSPTVNISITPPLGNTWVNQLNFQSGCRVRFITTGILPAPLVTNTDYYIINVGDTVLFSVATSLANAVSNVPISFTTNGTGLHMLVIQPSYGYASGTIGGSELHAQLQGEVGIHSHSYTRGTIDPILVQGGAVAENGYASTSDFTSSTPPPSPMNIINPFLALNHIIKL